MSKKSASSKKAQSACQLHPGNSDHLNYCKSLFGPQTKPLCPDCINSVFDSERFKPQFKVYSTQEIYSISFSTLSEDQTPPKNAPIDLLHNRLESIIVDNQSSGYDANSLVYLSEKQLLATCSTNGRVLFWSIGDVIDCVGELNFKGAITTAKYAQCKDVQYLLIVSENEIHIYDITKKIILKKVLQTAAGIQCIDVDSQYICAISGEGEFTMWGLETFASIQSFKVEGSSQKRPAQSIALVEKGGSAVLQDQDGVKKINFGSNLGTVQIEFRVTGKKSILGMHYLATAKKILVRVEGEGLVVLREKDLSTESKYSTKNNPETVAAHLVASEKGDQFLETTRINNFVVYHDKSKSEVFPITSLITKSCTSVILEDQYRFIIADALSGTLLVYRTNQNDASSGTKSPKKSPAKTSPKGKKGSPLKASRVISGQRTLFRKHHPVPLAIQERKNAKSKLKLKSTGGAKSRLALAKSSVDKSSSKKKRDTKKEEVVESDSSSSEEENAAEKPILETFKESVEKVGIDGETGDRVKSEKVYVVFEERKARGRGASKKDEKEEKKEKKGRGRSSSKKDEKGEKKEKKSRGRSSSKKKDEKVEKKGRGRPKKNDEDSRERSRSKSKSVARTKTSKKAKKKSK